MRIEFSNYKINPVSFYFVRHGETDWNVIKRITGQTDVPLNSQGLKQAHKVGEILQTLEIKSIFTSTLQRAKQTAEIIQTYINSPLEENPGLMDSKLGIIEGNTDRSKLYEWENGKQLTDAESLDDFNLRITNTINEILLSPGPILVVSHSGVWRHLNQILNGSIPRIPNATPILCRPYYLKPDYYIWETILL
ncbi:MAG: histidine phosphatase family protein [Sphingobacteriia bacterium]|nr:histidine phosphatase family protein [Sphingobacteriia bacterium]